MKIISSLFIVMFVPTVFCMQKKGEKLPKKTCLEFVRNEKQPDLLPQKPEENMLSRETCREFDKEIHGILMLLDYGWQLLRCSGVEDKVEHLDALYHPNCDMKVDPFMDVEEQLREVILYIIKKIKISGVTWCRPSMRVDSQTTEFKKEEEPCVRMFDYDYVPLNSLRAFKLWIRSYVPFIIFFLNYCLSKSTGLLFVNKPDVFDQSSEHYIDLTRILERLDFFVSEYIKLFGNSSACSFLVKSAFHQEDNKFLSEKETCNDISDCWCGIKKRIIECHKKQSSQQLPQQLELELDPVLDPVDDGGGGGPVDEENLSPVSSNESFSGELCGLGYNNYNSILEDLF